MLGLTTQKKYNEMEESYKEQIENVKKDYEDRLKNQKTAHSSNIEAITKKLNHEHKEELDKKEKAYKQSFEIMQKDYDTKIKSLESEKSNLEKISNTALAEADATKKENEILKKENISLTQELKETRELNQKLGNSNGGYKKSAEVQKEKIDKLEKDLAAARQKISELSKEELDKKVEPTIEAVKVYTGSKKDKKKYRGLMKGKRK